MALHAPERADVRPPHSADHPEGTDDKAGPGLIAAVGRAYFPIALVARLPYAMMVVGVLTLVVAARDSVALGGLTSAMVGLGAAGVGPFLGAAADRLGQRPVLLAAAVASSSAMALLAWTAYSDLPAPALLAVAFAVGAFAPQVAPMSRSRLVGVIGSRLAPSRRSRTFDTTMAYESAADETVFIIGPFLVGLLGTFAGSWVPAVAAAALTLVAVTAFALHPSAHAVQGHRATGVVPAPARDLRRPRVLVVVLGIFGVGLFFGTTLTSLTAFMDARGEADAAGLLYGVMGIGSAALALGVALFPARFTLARRWLVFAVVLLLGAAALPFAGSVGVIAVVLLVVGLGVGPTMVTQYSLGALRSPEGRSATVMTVLGSAVILGQSSASAATGAVADHWGATAALCLPAVAAGVVVLAGVVNAALERR